MKFMENFELAKNLFIDGLSCLENDNLEEAEIKFRQSLELVPDRLSTLINLSATLIKLRKYDIAKEVCLKAVDLDNTSSESWLNLGLIELEVLNYPEAISLFDKAIQLNNNFAEAWLNKGVSLNYLNKFDEAIHSLEKAISINENFADAWFNKGNVLKDIGKIDEAMANYRRALEIDPNYVKAHKNLGWVLQELGQLEDAKASYLRALEIKPDFAGALSNLLFSLIHNEAVDAQTLFAEHCHFSEQFESSLQANWPQHGNSRDPKRSLQVGFVSGDLRNHAVAHFIEPVLANLVKYPQLSLHAYSNHATEDLVTKRLREYFTHWHPVVGLTDDALAEQIRSDGIDILIDLSGHTGGNRLMTFARKPAPVQVSWMGYPGTTGLHAMDYYLADRFFLPPGQFDSQFTEKIVCLPASTPFLPAKAAPSVNALPALSNGYMTFGSFNRPSKISRSTIALWSQLLRTLPDSRMLLGAMNKDGNYTTLIEQFAQEGIDRERLDFHKRSSMERYLGLHHQVDICLDTYPYTGGTTTLHALWMGVPTLTLAGNTAAGRQGAAILGHAGLDAFVTHDAADFVQKGLSLVGDPAALSDIRSGSRERFAHSAMGQPALIAAGLERALRIMWQRWCEGLSPAAIDASGHQMTQDSRPLEN